MTPSRSAKRRTLREIAERECARIRVFGLFDGTLEVAQWMDGYKTGYERGKLAGHRAGKREGKAEAMKATGWGEP